MDVWEKLLSTALIGTDRAAFSIEPDDTPALVTQVSGDDQARRLLLAASVAGTYRRAGIVPPVVDKQPSELFPYPRDPAVETRPACGVPMMVNLNTVFQEPLKYKPLILEALILIGRKGRRIPHPYLPRLLDLAAVNRNDERWLAAIVNVMGERGKWLTTINKAWSFLDKPELWSLSIPDDPPVVTPEQEAWGIKHLELVGDGLIQPPTLHELTDHGAVWSRRLTGVFVTTLIRTCARLKSPNALSYMSEVVMFIPRSEIAPVLNELKVNHISTANGIAAFLEALNLRHYLNKDIANG